MFCDRQVLTKCYQTKGLDTGQAIRNIYEKDGLRGYFLGIRPRFAHVAGIITSQLVVYDLIKISLGLPMTGK